MNSTVEYIFSMIKIGITIGDINGIGPEVIIKALSNQKLLEYFIPIVYGSYKVLSYHKNIVNNSNLIFHSIPHPSQAVEGKINLINCWDENVSITLGRPTVEGGKYAMLALERAGKDIMENQIDAIVTAPVNKHALQLAKFPYPGHTEFFSNLDNNTKSLMLMQSEDLKVALVTMHVSLAQISEKINKEIVIEKIKTLNKTLIEDFGYDKPIIGVLGLNPHASDNGLMGNEEEKFITPAIIECKKQGILAMGPYPADGYFGSNLWRKTDATLAMYHDQGLIPFKALTFGHGTNVTAGLTFIRTSPDHGTAYDIAGKNQADASSFLQAIYTALDVVRNRTEYFDSRENALVRKVKKSAGIHE